MAAAIIPFRRLYSSVNPGQGALPIDSMTPHSEEASDDENTKVQIPFPSTNYECNF
jgi:hypothetical protein